MPIHMTDHFAQMLGILSKTRRHTLHGPQIHRHPQNNQEAVKQHSDNGPCGGRTIRATSRAETER
jgi:hypothetical protein